MMRIPCQPVSRSNRLCIILLILLLTGSAAFCQEYEETVKIHYLGHSAFVMQFDNGINIVTDYGHYNIWADYGWDSPIHSIGDLVPDVMTFSHEHEDHYDPDRIPEGVPHILWGNDTLDIEGIQIRPVRTCESNINEESNTSFIFTYKGLKICHLADAQAQIMNIEDPAVKAHIKTIFPDTYDLLFMTIEGTSKFIKQAHLFVDLLSPKRIIPIHYWSEAYLQDFLEDLTHKNLPGCRFTFKNIDAPEYILSVDETVQPVETITLRRAPFELGTSMGYEPGIEQNFRLLQNYPNPFNAVTSVDYWMPESGYARLRIFDVLGCPLVTLVDGRQQEGNHRLFWDASGYPSGVYYLQLTAESRESMLESQTRRMMLVK